MLGDVAAHGQYAAIGQPVDAMLRVYLERNGAYRVEPLLEAGYRAHNNDMNWLIEITAAANEQGNILSTIESSDWIQKGQRGQMLRHILELERRKAQATPSAYDYAVDEAESSLVSVLLDEKKTAEAHAELALIPEDKRYSAQWLGFNLRLAEADGSLPQLVAQWKKHPKSAPASNSLRGRVLPLTEQSRRIVMRFVYEQALEARELTAPNFLGLAAIDLDENDVPGAVALLKRLTLVSGNAYADADSAVGLLEKRSKYAEAIQFLGPLAEALPWDASYRVRLAAATLAGDAQSRTALQTLAAVAGDPKAKYVDRATAATALKGHGTAATASGSAEMDLLERGGCPSGDETNKPYFVEARLTAATCTPSDLAKESIPRFALAVAPDNAEVRLKYAWSAFAAGVDARALVAAEPIFENSRLYGPVYARVDDSSISEEEASPPAGRMTLDLKPADAARLTWFAIHAREKRREPSDALTLAQTAASRDPDPARRQAFEKEQKRLEFDAAREAENEARAPKIHSELDQDRVVRPRLLPGMPFDPKKATNSQGELE